ncbi:CoA-transferase [Conexibacter sp. CPCC 206217]|uniref:CoA-transferase n=1 Tax=Conexibacter sp. CPCC 206217 TaxID=3064574 RepID=UPI0027276D2D|nr:CoA-transferase [Conexibacter sp. CPCC 206217]MDO8210115.1 CoA-transferase [Conexibacter sp. CPCC 206217]
MSGLTVDALARRLARDIPAGACVNLGIGLPTALGPYLGHAICHSENGVLGMAPLDGHEPDVDLINASKEPIGLAPGGSFFDHATSFAMIRAGYVDVSVMGAFQVSAGGDLANWSTGDPAAIPSVGGAMDLAVGARAVWVMMRHMTRDGTPRLVRECTYPLTARRVVKRIYTDLAVLTPAGDGFVVEELAPGVDVDAVRDATAAPVSSAAAELAVPPEDERRVGA